MLTIKEFAKLCSCNTQTLRYYDRIGLLKPAKTDAMTGYRYYQEKQAVDFIKIKNLQYADFTIDEIKILLSKTDEQVVQAFDEKIRIQTEKLEHIRKIQTSYLKEKKMMEKAVAGLTSFIVKRISDESMMKEFEFQPEDKEKIQSLITKYFTHHLLKGLEKEKGELHLQINDQMIVGEDEVVSAIESLNDDSLNESIIIGKEDTNFVMNEEFNLDHYQMIWEKHKWHEVREFINEVPPLHENEEYLFFFELSNLRDGNVGITFAMCLIAAMILRNEGKMINIGCNVEQTSDGRNHVKLYQKD